MMNSIKILLILNFVFKSLQQALQKCSINDLNYKFSDCNTDGLHSGIQSYYYSDILHKK